ncbi:MAG: 5-methyltetrahydropteroyltriglutamate--homocysteine S-methyltransferase [Betaproteobacteria bacterium]
MVSTHILGYPRVGGRRELKYALEAYWRGESDEAGLRRVGAALRARRSTRQTAAGLRFITAGDFSYYDHVLDHAAMLGCLPRRFGFDARKLTLHEYFVLARGDADRPALEMTKWFDTNYHYLVPEIDGDGCFDGGPEWYFDDIREALALGTAVKPVLIGPLTFLRLAKFEGDHPPTALIGPLAARYAAILERLKAMGVAWVQIDEPALCLDLEPGWLDALTQAYDALAADAPRLLLATYFDDASDYRNRIVRLPVNGLHLDLVRAPSQLGAWRDRLPSDWVLSAGLVDGRNVWRTDLRRTYSVLQPLYDVLGERLWLAPSCSLLHVPITLADEDRLDPEVRPWLAFANEKVAELQALATALDRGVDAVRAAFDASDRAQEARRRSARAVKHSVRARVAALTGEMFQRAAPYCERATKQRLRLRLPRLPTTTIGSFPQTAAVRHARAAFRRGEMGHLQYLEAMRAEIRHAIARQEALGLDVLVHGEAERNDMVEYFAEHLWGCALTRHGWVQSYGSRCVKPPIIYGDVCRPEPITLETARYAQSLSAKPVKGMLTGPVTILQWSFARDDQPRAETALQIALALRDEVTDLQQAGLSIVQIDEPALREALPLKKRNRAGYLDWAVRAFRLAASAAADETQIHTHMCYAEFSDILPAIAALDADVITLETSRSNMSLLDAFGEFQYPNAIGPGVYDIHSPRVPQTDDIVQLIERAAAVIPPGRLWVNPDCGLKTRGWPEVEAALRSMVAAAHAARTTFAPRRDSPPEMSQ